MNKQLLNRKDLDRIISRISHEIIERNRGVEGLCIVGVQRGGILLAHRLARRIESIEGVGLPVGTLDISPHRDDKGLRQPQPDSGGTVIPCDISGRRVIIADDVIFTGRTIRAAMDALMDFGRPAQIQLFVLIDRGHRELPIRPDFVGKNIPTSLHENINVRMGEEGMEDSVFIESSEGLE
jgi:pyrimidine operon attenuation protein / uracil phosphoribosyltransferase